MEVKLILLSFYFVCNIIVLQGQSTRSCYSCVYTFNENRVGYECVNEPWNVTGSAITTECPETDDQGETQYCHTFTQQLKDYEKNIMYIYSMVRSCSIETTTGCVNDANFVSHYDYCDNNLCNNEDQSPQDGETIPDSDDGCEGSDDGGDDGDNGGDDGGQSERECYVCGYTRNEGQVGYECVNQTETVSVPIACPVKDDQDRTQYCHTFTQQIKDYETNTMYIQSLLRTCQIKTVEEGCVDDANYKTCYSYCPDSLCNDQDESHKDGEAIPDDDDDAGDGGDGGADGSGSGNGDGSGDDNADGGGSGDSDDGGGNNDDQCHCHSHCHCHCHCP